MSAYIDEIKDYLKKNGLRKSTLRDKLLFILDQAEKPLSVPDTLKILLKDGLKPNKTTIYREFTSLKKLGVVFEIDLLDGSKKYELSLGHAHQHLVCIKCSSVRCVRLNNTIEAWLKSFCAQENFELKNHVLEFFGLCQNCKS